MHIVQSTTQNLIDSQVNYCSELKMSQINEDNAELVILTEEEAIQSLNIKEEQIKKVINRPRIIEASRRKPAIVP